jgi:hypothetical protein
LERDVERLITVAPAVQRVKVETDRLPRCPWVIIHGDRDELVDPVELHDWARALSAPPEIISLSGVDHFFHGRLNELRDVVVRWLDRQADAAAGGR